MKCSPNGATHSPRATPGSPVGAKTLPSSSAFQGLKPLATIGRPVGAAEDDPCRLPPRPLPNPPAGRYSYSSNEPPTREGTTMAKGKEARHTIKLVSSESSYCYFTEKNKNNS